MPLHGEFIMTALAVSALNEQQRELVKYLVVDGKPLEEAAKLAGYHPKSAYRTLRLPRGGRCNLGDNSTRSRIGRSSARVSSCEVAASG